MFAETRLRAELRRLSYPFTANSSLERLQALIIRADRRLPSYDKCAVAEIRKLLQQRGVVIDKASLKDTSKLDLVELLEAADEDKRFTKFQDLPAELRIHVYEYYFAHLRETNAWMDDPLTTLNDGIQPARLQAPLVKASQLLRRESLPLWYAMSSLAMPVITEPDYSAGVLHWIMDRGFGSLRPIYPAWFTHCREFHIGLELDTFKQSIAFDQHLRWRVQLSPRGSSFELHALHANRNDETPANKNARKEIETKLRKLFENFCKARKFWLTRTIADEEIPAIFGAAARRVIRESLR